MPFQKYGQELPCFLRDGLPASLDVLKDETGEFVFGLINPEGEGVIPEKRRPLPWTVQMRAEWENMPLCLKSAL